MTTKITTPETDIVERLRSMYYELSRRQASTPFGERSELSGIPELLYEAAIKIQAAIVPDAVSLMDKAIAEIKRLRQENATLTAEHDALRAERDEVRQSYCSLMEAYRGGNGRVTANKLGWGYLFEEDKENTND